MRSIFYLFFVLFSSVSFANDESCQVDPPLTPVPVGVKIYVNNYRYAEGDRTWIQFYGITQAFRARDGYVVTTVEGEEPSVYRMIYVTKRRRFVTDFIKLSEKNTTRIEIFFKVLDGSLFSTVGFANSHQDGFCGFTETGRAD
ncbi:MAG: hypothetical protein AAB309_03560 [Deltaproteobacteria bacterium]